MAFHLVVISGREAGQRFPLVGEKAIIGRDPTTDIHLDALGASREHCAITLRDGRTLAIEDLGSRNGTKVNGSLISGNRTLQVGDRLTIGTTDCLIADDRFHGQARLQIIAGANAGRELPLVAGEHRIGRGSQADIIIDDQAASRINTALGHEQGVWYVEDRKSANGTLLNGDRVSGRQTLRSGDFLQIGSTIFTFIDGRIEDLAGRIFGQATLIRRVGSGSLGVVYQAKLQGSGKMVAVKIIDPAITAKPAEKARIIGAARRAMQVQDDQVVAVFDCGVVDDLCYVTSDWAENGSLGDLLSASGHDLPPPMVVVSMLYDAAKGLRAASAEGLYHQGLRPGNLLIFRDGMVRVADFGVTARYESDGCGGLYPYYVSPEELAQQAPTASANQFSLGAIGYHALSGEPPFAADDMASSASARLTSCLPSVLDFNREVPAPLAAVIGRMLALSADDRYPDWDSVCSDLEQIMDMGAQARIAPASGSAMAGHLTSNAPRRSQGQRRGRGVAPQVREVRRANQQQRTVVMVAIAACLLLGVFIVAMSSGGSGGTTSPTSTRSNDTWRSSSTSEQAPVIARNTDLNLPPPNRRTAPEVTAPASPSPDSPPAARASGSREQPASDSPPATITAAEGQADHRAAAMTDAAAADTTDSGAIVDGDQAQDSQSPVAEANSETDAAPTNSDPAQPIDDAVPPTASNGNDHLANQLPPREGPLLHFARPDTWNDGHIILTDGEQRGIAVRVDSEHIVIRERSGEEQRYPESVVASMHFDPPNSPRIRRGDSLLSRKDFTAALAAYDEVAEAFADHPYLKKQVHIATDLQQRLADAEQSIVNGQLTNDGPSIMEGIIAYLEIMEPRRLDAGYAQAWQEVWPQVAGRMDGEERQAIMTKARAVGVRLSYDERAPELLAEAMTAAAAEEPNHREIAKLFDAAATANAYFDDEASLAYAESLIAIGNQQHALNWLQRVSSAGRSSERYQALSLSLGLRPPPLDPVLLVNTYIGGSGNQSIHSITISNGVVVAKGNNFEVAYQLNSLRGVINGDISHDEGDARYSTQPPWHPRTGNKFTDPRSGHTYHNRMRQVHPILQQPMLTSSAGWTMYGQNYEDINPGTKGIRWGTLMADSRGYDVWMMPDGMIGAKFWTDGGNSVLTRHPLDITKPNPIESMNPYFKDSGGMASLFLLIDPTGSEPAVKGGTFIRGMHMTNQVVDRWGRVYLPAANRSVDFRFGSQGGGGGLFVLRPDLLRPELNIRFGGSGSETFAQIAMEENILVLGGRTQSKDLVTHNAIQEQHGGGDWDAWLVILKLW